MTFDANPLFTVQYGERYITVLGTAHVSRASAEKVSELLASGEFDAVAVELCVGRHKKMTQPDSMAEMDLFQALKRGQAATVAASLALGAFQQRTAEQLGIEPGAEMHAAINDADKAGYPVLLIDRDVGITLKRIYRNIPFWQRSYLITGLLYSVVTHREVSEEEIERLKEGDVLESTFAQFAEKEHDLYVPLIEERDNYMAARLMQEVTDSKHRHILAVVGAGHFKGIKQLLCREQLPLQQELEEELEKLDHVPASGSFFKWLPWLITALVLTGFGIGFSHSSELGWQLIMDWVLINGGLSALGALFACAHPVTIAGAFIAAPITSLNPMIGAGMVTAAIEIWLRKPSVGDFERLRTDTTHIRGWWSNRVSRTLLVFLFATLGSAIGTYIAGFRILERLT
jgi:pheromone shutdown-related protein TraB